MPGDGAAGKKVKKKRKKMQVRRVHQRPAQLVCKLPDEALAACRPAHHASLCFGLDQIVANLQHCGYPIIHRAAKDMGWKVAERGESWDFGWSDNNHLLREMSKMFSHPRTLQPVQRINHLPNNKHLYRKDTLANNMMNLRAELPDAFRAMPCVSRRSE